jgi:hypothetical protein
VELTPTGISYTKRVFQEASTNNGTFTQTSDISLVGDSFTGSDSDDFVSQGKVVVANLPAGLTAVVTRNSANEATLSFTGAATAHAGTDSVTDLTVTFQDTAFTSGDASGVQHASRNDLTLRFYDSNLSYAPQAFSEASNNNGSVLEIAEITLFGDTFTAGPFTENTHFTVANSPAGLTPNVQRASDTSAYIYFSGNATSHGTADTIHNLQFTFTNSAFTGGDASAILSSTSPQMSIYFFDSNPVSPRTITYNSSSFNEASANDGTVTGTASITLYGDRFLGDPGEDLVVSGKVIVSNLPAGLTATVLYVTVNQAELSFGGSATNHASSDSVSNLTLSFQNSAFIGGDASAVTGSMKNDLAINFDDSPVPAVTTQAVTGINTDSATGNGTITALGTPNPTAHGDCYATTANPTIPCTNEGAASTTGAFTSNMTGLTSGATYYVRAYATNTAGTAYGSDVTFTTPKAPSVDTQAISSVTPTGGTGNGNILDLGTPNPTAHGVCYATTANPTTPCTNEGAASATGAFTSNMTGLTPATTYHVRAYATNTAGTSYGSDVSFITAPSTTIPTLSTSEITNIQGNSAYGGGNVSDNGGTAITKRGICWSTTPSPTTDDVCISQTPSGSGEGQFFTPITRLETSTTYYVRAYATNGNGTGYGEERSFKTDLYFFIRALPAINQGFNQLSDR